MAKIDRTLSQEENLVKQLKEDNPRFIYPASTLTFGPALEPQDEARNTSVLATAVAGAAFTGDKVYHYNRLDIANGGIDPLLGTSLTVGIEDDEVTVQIKALQYFNLIEEAVSFSAYNPVTEDADGSVTISTVQPSLLYLPSSVVITLVKQGEEPVTLADLADVDLLNGFDPESSLPVPEYVYEPIIEAAPVSSAEVKEDGTLLVGLGNPSTDMTIAHNGEISLALSARLYNSVDTVAPSAEGNVYTLAVEDNEDWNFPISVALTNNGAGDVITNLYDVELKLRNYETELSVVFKLVPSEGGYDWYSEIHDLRITDNTVSQDQSVVQNIQRMRFYASQLEVANFNSFGSALGTYDISLKATRIDSNTPPVELTIRAETLA